MRRALIVAAAAVAALLASAGVAHAQAVQVCAPFDGDGKAVINDDRFAGKASTSSTELTEFCMSLVGPGLGQPGPTRFTILASPSGVPGSCEGTGPDATRIKVTCEDGVVTKLRGRVK
jgi:hypothetical protein